MLHSGILLIFLYQNFDFFSLNPTCCLLIHKVTLFQINFYFYNAFQHRVSRPQCIWRTHLVKLRKIGSSSILHSFSAPLLYEKSILQYKAHFHLEFSVTCDNCLLYLRYQLTVYIRIRIYLFSSATHPHITTNYYREQSSILLSIGVWQIQKNNKTPQSLKIFSSSWIIPRKSKGKLIREKKQTYSLF